MKTEKPDLYSSLFEVMAMGTPYTLPVSVMQNLIVILSTPVIRL